MPALKKDGTAVPGNYLHLDLKGTIPGYARMLEFLRFFKKCGYDGIVWEYEDRLPWRSWKGNWRGGFDMRIWEDCRTLDLEVIPLIQTLGHLEWLLKHDEYSGLRENGLISELCPLHPEGMGHLKRWLNEVAELHPESRFIHLGLDETWFLGSCEKCRRHDKMQLYLNHAKELCEYVLSLNLRPMLWGDMFWREQRLSLARELPPGTVLVDWQYGGEPPYDTTLELQRSGHTVMGASAAMCSWWEHAGQMQGPPGDRIRNVTGWKRRGDANGMGIIHTTWGRGNSLMNIYGPWHGAVPAFIAGGRPERWETHPWNRFMKRITRVMERGIPQELEAAATAVLEMETADEIEAQSRLWWHLALRYHSIRKDFTLRCDTRRSRRKVMAFTGHDEAMYRRHCIEPVRELQKKLIRWEEEARQFWRDNELSDETEFFATHSDIVKAEMERYLENPDIRVDL